MNYDSKKTLSENREILNEDLNNDFAKILSDASAGAGTNPADIIGVLKQIKNMTQFLDVEKKFVQRYPYKNDGVYRFQDMINKEMENNNYDDIEEIAKELRRIGYKVYWSNDVSNGKTKPNTYKTGSFIMSSAYAPQTKKQSQVVVDKGKKDELNKNNFNWVAAPTIEDAKNGKYIKYGMIGDSVVEIQTKLNEKGGYKLETKTKKFGANTKNALIDFQKKNNITPSEGVFGPKTWRVLFTSPNANIEKLPQTRQEEPKITGTIQNVSGVMDTEKELEKERQSGTYLPQGEEGPINKPDYSQKQGQLTNQNPGTISQKKLNRR
jgi:peptidoglycan hydrolase-like protein with peptidoglycan-binding domain